MDFEIRKNRERSQGRKRLTQERAAYLRLMRQGVSNKPDRHQRQAVPVVNIRSDLQGGRLIA
ncbi:hypothetical protein DKM19_47730 [Streptosporangium sp. 'caverna']|nr:hypothetical protein DKM19_47730 [Streptosporangium sp. 'caverna']